MSHEVFGVITLVFDRGFDFCDYLGVHDIIMVITYSKSKDQPGKVANLARGQLNR